MALLDRARPDLLVAVGGGSVIDAAKAMRLFYEHPEKTLDDLTLPFLDPRKRVADYPRDAHRVRLVAIPTTSGTGSEVSPGRGAHASGERKETLVDYCLVPDMAIVDPLLTLSMPPSVTVDSGIDALTHALEAAVSIFASPYTDAFCVQAARLIFDALPKVYDDPADLAARTDMANAATLAGLAFSNAFVGTNHALAHAVGARFGIAHGRANGIFLPHVLRYNAGLPSKFMPAPGYSAYIAPEKYAQLGRVVFGGREPEESRRRLFQGVEDLLDRLEHAALAGGARGLARTSSTAALPELAMTAFQDLSNRTNPRMPLRQRDHRAADGSGTTGGSPMPTDTATQTVEVEGAVRRRARHDPRRGGPGRLDPRDPRGRAARGLRGRRPARHGALQGVGDRGHRRVHAVLRAHRRHHELDDGRGPDADRAGGLLHARGGRARRGPR